MQAKLFLYSVCYIESVLLLFLLLLLLPPSIQPKVTA